MTNDGRYDKLTPVPIPSIPPVEIACVLNAASSNGIVHLECEIKDRPLEEALEIQIRLSELESVYRYLIGGLDDEGDDGNPIIRPMTGFDVWDIMRSKQICQWPSTPEPQGTVVDTIKDIYDTPAFRKFTKEAIDRCAFCGRLEAGHFADDAQCKQFISTMDEQSESDESCKNCKHPQDWHNDGCSCYHECDCGHFTKAEQSESVNEQCSECSHSKAEHEPVCMMNHCSCPEFTKVSQSESCSQLVQPERSSQSPEPQLLDHFPGKYRRDQIAANLVAHMENTLKSNRREALDQVWVLSFQTSLALLTSLVAECPTCYTLVAQALSSLHQTLDYSHPTHRAHLNFASPTE